MTDPLASQDLVHAVLADMNLAIAHLDAGLGILGWSVGHTWSAAGRSALDVFPELIGCEDGLSAVARGQAARFELPLINRLEPGGLQEHYLSLICLPHPVRPGHLLLLVQDVTALGRLGQQITQQLNEMSLLRRQLEAANARLIRLDAVKSAFVELAAHDLRNPLAVVKGYVEDVREHAALDEEARQSLGIVLARVDHMVHLIDRLLDVDRMEAG